MENLIITGFAKDPGDDGEKSGYLAILGNCQAENRSETTGYLEGRMEIGVGYSFQISGTWGEDGMEIIRHDAQNIGWQGIYRHSRRMEERARINLTFKNGLSVSSDNIVGIHRGEMTLIDNLRHRPVGAHRDAEPWLPWPITLVFCPRI